MPYKDVEKHRECVREAQRRRRLRPTGQDVPLHQSNGRPNDGKCRNGHALPNGGSCRECYLAKKKRYELKSNYGIADVAERNALLAAQGNACDICGRTDCTWGVSYNDCWQIDHDHERPGTHRSILCGTCNCALGRLEKYLIRVVKYMMKWSPAFAEQIKQL